MKKSIFFIFLSLLLPLLSAPVAFSQYDQKIQESAQPLQNITLKDGTVLKGRVIGMANGIYTIETPSLGTMTIPASDLASITANRMTTTSQMPRMQNQSMGSMQGDTMGQIQQQMLSDPEVMQVMTEIMADPELLSLFQDKTMLQDIFSMDAERAKNNPSLQKMLEHPLIQKLMAIMQPKMHPAGYSQP